MMEEPIKFSPWKIQIKFLGLFLLMWVFWLSFLRYLDTSPWYVNLLILTLVIGTPCVGMRTYLLRRESHQLISLVLPELEEGTLLPSDVDYIDESLKIIIYDHYLIGYAMGDCIDLDDIQQLRVPLASRPNSISNLQGKLKSGGYFSIYTPSYFVYDPKGKLYQLANYLSDNFGTSLYLIE